MTDILTLADQLEATAKEQHDAIVNLIAALTRYQEFLEQQVKFWEGRNA